MPATVLADVNIWLATLVESHPHHDKVLAWWQRTVVPQERTVSFCRITQMSLLRLLTNPIVMGASARSPSQAWEDYDRMIAQEQIDYLREPPGLDRVFREASQALEAGRGWWTDAYLASLAIAAGAGLVTLDRGFRRFERLELELL